MRTLIRLIRVEGCIILALVINIRETAHLTDESFRLVAASNESSSFGCFSREVAGSNRKLRP